MTAFLAGWIGVITTIATSALPLFIGATIVAGAGQGIAISAATRGLLHGSTLADQTAIFAVVYLLSYSGATTPSPISASLSRPIAPNWVRSSGECAMAGCGQSSATWLRSTTPSPPSTRLSGSSGRRSSAFVP